MIIKTTNRMDNNKFYTKENLEAIIKQTKSNPKLFGYIGQRKDCKNPLPPDIIYSNFKLTNKGLEADVKSINKEAEELLNSDVCEFGIRALGVYKDNKIQIEKLISFDLIPRQNKTKGKVMITETHYIYTVRYNHNNEVKVIRYKHNVKLTNKDEICKLIGKEDIINSYNINKDNVNISIEEISIL